MSKTEASEVRERITKALGMPEPLDVLHATLQALVSSGYPKDALILDLNSLRDEFRSQKREPEEDLILEGLDFLVGWASPHMKIR